MASSSSFLILPSSLSPKSLFLSKPTTKSSPSSLFFNSFSLKTTTTTTTNNKSFSISSAFNSERRSYNKSVTSEFDDQEEKEEVVVSSGRTRTDLNPAQDEFKLYVGNLSVNVDSAQLVGLFEKAGNVKSVKVIYDKMTGRSRGFAFVYMSTVEEAKAAAKKFHDSKLEGKGTITVNYGPPPSRDKHRSRAPPLRRGGGDSFTRCYVGNLSLNVDDEALMTLFNEPGEVLEARVVYDRESGRSMGFGYVTYGSYEEVENAISSLNGFELNGKKIRVCAEERQSLAYSNNVTTTNNVMVPINES